MEKVCDVYINRGTGLLWYRCKTWNKKRSEVHYVLEDGHAGTTNVHHANFYESTTLPTKPKLDGAWQTGAQNDS